MRTEANVVEGLHHAWHAFREEDSRGANFEVLSRINADLDAHEDAKLRVRREQLVAELARSRREARAAAEREDLEANEAFFAYARFGLPGERGDFGEIEQKWRACGREKRLDLERRTLVASDDPAGGYLAPVEFADEIIKAAVLYSPMRDIVKVRKTVRRAVHAPKRTGTAAAVWIAEAQTRSETQNPSYGAVEVPTHEMTAEIYVSFADLEDSAFDLEAELSDECSEQFGVTEGAAVVSGNGIGKPIGFLDASQGIGSIVSGSATTIADVNGQADGIINLCHDVKSAYAARARWVLNRKTLGSVRKLKDAQKQYLWAPSPAVGMPSTILGAPYTEAPDMPDEGANTFPIAFGDWTRGYMLVDRISLSMLRDPYTKANVGQVKFLVRRRVGGQVVLAEALRLLKCSA